MQGSLRAKKLSVAKEVFCSLVLRFSLIRNVILGSKVTVKKAKSSKNILKENRNMTSAVRYVEQLKYRNQKYVASVQE
jgi:hypothetical protein